MKKILGQYEAREDSVDTAQHQFVNYLVSHETEDGYVEKAGLETLTLSCHNMMKTHPNCTNIPDSVQRTPQLPQQCQRFATAVGVVCKGPAPGENQKHASYQQHIL